MLYLENLCLSIVIYWNMSQGLRVARGYELKAWKYEFKLKSTRSDPRVTRVQIDKSKISRCWLEFTNYKFECKIMS